MTGIGYGRPWLVGALAVAGMAACPAGAGSQTIVEFSIPTADSMPSTIVAGPDGNLYFLESNGIARITPDGSIVESPTSCSPVPGPPWTTFPNIALTIADGSLWYTGACWIRGPGPFGTEQGIVGTMNLEGAFHVVRNSVDIAPAGITTGPDGNLWYADGRGKIVRSTPAGAIITEYPVPGPNLPSGISSGADGFLWFTQAFAPSIGKISLDGVITQFPLLAADRVPGNSVLGPDGNMWFTESSLDGLASWIGRITPDGAITDFPIPTFAAGAGGITAGPDGNLWFTESGSGVNITSKIGRIDLAGSITEFTVPTSNSSPAGIISGPDGNIWFTEIKASKIGRVNLDQLPGCEPTTTALCLASGRFRVESQWRRPEDAVFSAGHAVPITGDTGYFWFFDPSNIEVVTKVLNGCQLDGRYWFFAGGLTNVEVAIAVTDTQTNTVKAYTNSQGSPFAPIQDTAAFSTCP